MTALDLIKEEIKNSRENFEGTVADISTDMLYKDPGGKALPLGSVFTHNYFSEDYILNKLVRNETPLCEGEYKDNTGVDLPVPAMDENWSENNEKWARNVRIDLEKFREYSKAVNAKTDEFISSLSDEDLDKDIELGNWGKMKLSFILYAMIIAHTYNLSGEISALKGIQGKKGYSF